MMKMLYFLIIISLFFGLSHCNQCLITASDNEDHYGTCQRGTPLNHVSGCGVVKFIQDLNGLPDIRRICYHDLAVLHPFFAVLRCPHSIDEALCYSQYTPDMIEYDMKNNLKLGEQSIGEVLRIHGIDRFCCCRGYNCNQVNMKMHNYVENTNRYTLTRHEVDEMRKEYYPGGSEIRRVQYGKGSTAFLSFFAMIPLFILYL